VKIRRLGSSGRFYEIDDDSQCAWCAAAARVFDRDRDLVAGDMVHLENDKGTKRTITITETEPTFGEALTLECEPYIFFSE